jgi:hypothetical protein
MDTPSHERITIQDRRTQARGQVVRVYPEGWLLAEMEDVTWSLFTREEVEVVQAGDRGAARLPSAG